VECKFAEQRLQALLDDELAGDELAEVEAHLSSCDSCRRAMDELRRVDETGRMVYNMPPVDDAAFLSAVMKRSDVLRDSPPPDPDRVIAGYEIIRKLGTGAMGSVFLARQVSLDRTVALKILPKSMVRDKEFEERFIREARATAKLSHENIVHGIDAGRSGDVLYFAMEYVDGKSVRDIIRETGRLEEKQAVDIGLQMARALEHAGRSGLIHRDIKPDNILIGPGGVAKLCDLGLAKAEKGDASLTQDGFVVGTPHYIAPEQARGEPDLDARVDIYALGSTLYMMVTGQVPFDGPTSAIVMARHITDPFPDPRKIVPSLSAGLVTVMHRMVEKDKNDRYADATALREDLEALAEGRLKADVPERLPPTGSTTRVRRALAQRARRSRAPSPASILLAGGAVVAAAAAVFFALSGGGASRRDRLPVDAPKTARRGPAGRRDVDPRESSAKSLVDVIRTQLREEPESAEKHLRLLDDAMATISGTSHEVEAITLRTEIVEQIRTAADRYVARALKSADKLIEGERFDLALEDGGPLDRSVAPRRARERITAARTRALTGAQQLLDARLRRAGDFGKLSEAEFMALMVGLPRQLAAKADGMRRDALDAARDAARARAARRREERRHAAGARIALTELSGEVNGLIERGEVDRARERVAAAKRDRKFASIAAELEREAAFVASYDDARRRLVAALEALAKEHASVSFHTRERREPIRGRVEGLDAAAMRLEMTISLGGGATARSRLEVKRIATADLAGLIRGQYEAGDAAAARAVAAFLVSRGDYAGAELAYRAAAEGGGVTGQLARLLDVRRHRLAKLFRGRAEPLAEGRMSVSYDFADARQLDDWQIQPLPGDADGERCKRDVTDGALVLAGLGGMRTRAKFLGDVTIEIEVEVANTEQGAAVLVCVDEKKPDSFYAAIAGFDRRAYLEKWAGGFPRHAGGVDERLEGVRRLTIEIARAGSRLQYRVGDLGECSYQDGQYKGGGVALLSLGDEASFRSVKVTGTLNPEWMKQASGDVVRRRLAYGMSDAKR